MAAFHPPMLEIHKATIIEDLKILLNKAKSPVERTIIKTSLMRLGVQTEMPSQREIQEIRLTDQRKFSFFQARAPYYVASFLTDLTLRANIVNYNFFSPTYDKILLLENMVLRKELNQLTSSH
jgi:hypothetical protein